MVDGKIKQLKLGNGLWETAQFNNLLQVTEFALGTTQGGYNVWKANYDYGELQSGGSVDATKNSGNIAKQTVTFSGLANPFIQGYKYDPLDRITEAKETVNGTQTWIQNWGYDRYGNRSSFSQNIFGYTSVSNPTISSTTNRFTSGGFTFDKNGNVTFDHNGYEFTYDGNNKQTQVTLMHEKGGLTTMGSYFYDGDGKRVKKGSYTGDNILFVYDAAGKLIEERNASTGALVTSYIYAGSRLLSTETSSATTYMTADHLGSPRINTDGSGNVVARHDYMPFGEEIFPWLTAQRTSGVGYTSDTVRKQFTGYERDGETGLDYAQARMYAITLGRFTTSDPIKFSDERKFDPQRLNLYTYVQNNPLSVVDPTGTEIIRLGRAIDKIEQDISKTEKALEGKLTSKARQKLENKLTRLGAELEGNQKVGAWLAAGQSIGELKGVKLSNLAISTEPEKDYVNVQLAATKKDNPRATKAQIERLRPDAEQQAKDYFKTNPYAYTSGATIYIPTETFLYGSTSLALPERQANMIGAGVIGHERIHVDRGRAEDPAYKEELRILQKFNPEVNQTHVRDRIDFIRKQKLKMP